MRTRSKQEPPPKYSMTIHSFTPLTKLVMYCDTYGLLHVPSRAISACMSDSSSLVSSRSILEI